MYKPFIIQTAELNQPVAIRKPTNFDFYSILPHLPPCSELIKNPIDPEFNDVILLNNQREAELSKFESLSSPHNKNSVLVQKSWFLDWKNYIHGGKFPGILRTSGILDNFGRPRPKSFIKLSSKQYNFLKDIYNSENIIEVSSLSNIKRPKSRNLSASNSRNNSLINSDNEGSEELVTLMDENFCKTLEKKNSETETLPEQCLKFMKKQIGLENPAFFCYLNCVLQCFLSIPEVISFFVSLRKSPDPKSQRLTHQVYSIVYAMLSNDQKVIRPVFMWKEVSKQFPPGLQHDFFDFWRFLIASIEKENRVVGIVPELFKGKLNSKLECRVCHKQAVNYEDFYELSLEFSQSLKKCLRKFSQSEKIKCFCEHCKTKTKHFKTFIVAQAPKILVVQVKRFKSGSQPVKIDEFCKFHKQIKISGLNGEENFSLISIAEHKGSMNYGHYNAYCKRNSKWFKFNDSKVYKIPLARVLKKKVYCAVYEKTFG